MMKHYNSGYFKGINLIAKNAKVLTIRLFKYEITLMLVLSQQKEGKNDGSI